MKPTVTLQKTEKAQALVAALAALRRKDVLVGIPAEKSSRKGEGPNNAELLYIHTHGSELRHIPPRPVIEPAIEDAKQPIAELLGHAMQETLAGRAQPAETYLRAAGARGMAAAVDWFFNPLNHWAENAPATVRAKLAKLQGKRKKDALDAVESGESMAGINTPLIDTGQMRKAITYVVREE